MSRYADDLESRITASTLTVDFDRALVPQDRQQSRKSRWARPRVHLIISLDVRYGSSSIENDGGACHPQRIRDSDPVTFTGNFSEYITLVRIFNHET